NHNDLSGMLANHVLPLPIQGTLQQNEKNHTGVDISDELNLGNTPHTAEEQVVFNEGIVQNPSTTMTTDSTNIIEPNNIVESNEAANPPHDITVGLRRSTRRHQPVGFLQDYHCNLLQGQVLNTTIPYSISNYLSYDKLSASHQNFIFNISSIFLPSSSSQVRLLEKGHG
ncbi:unnamed protein product, partial [Citrullus colocynthis]